MSQNSTGAGPSSSAEGTSALIVNSAATSAHVVESLLDGFLDALSSNEAGHPDIDDSIGLIRRELDGLVLARGQGEQEIKNLIQDVLDREVVQHLEREIRKNADECVEKMLPKLVESLIDEYVPKSLREEVDRSKDELNTLRIEFHNINARNQNAGIRTMKHIHEPLCHLLNKNGVRSDFFPASVDELLKLNDKELSELVKFYGKSPRGKKSENVNLFLQFSGALLYYPPS